MKRLKYSHKCIIILLPVLVLMVCSCTKNFEKYNTNPNALPLKDINKDNVYLGGFFKQMEESIFPVGGTGTDAANAYQLINNLCGDIFGCYNGMTHNWNAAGDNTTYNFSVGWNAAAFNSFYNNIVKNCDTINKYAANSPDILAVAKIIKVEAAHRVVDMYGPIPYFKTQTSLGSFGSPYDATDAIYYSFFKDLDSAILTLKTAIVLGGAPLENFDAVYAGNYTQWVRFANSLKLRLALRISYVDPAKAKEYAESAISDEIGVITQNTDNAEMRGVNNVKYNNPLETLSDAYQEARMSANMESYLKGYNDPRLAIWFSPSKITTDPANTYRGIRSGSIIADGSKYQPFSSLKTDFNLIWMPAAEVYFLRAEGAAKGWNMGSTAQDLYETGIKRSFEQWGAGDATSYIANSTAKAAAYSDPVNSSNNVTSSQSTITIKWNEADNFEVKQERILTQKWLAMYPNGQEAWSEYRRTGYPVLFSVLKNLGNDPRLNNMPVKRLPYPTSEYQQNGANVAKGVQLLGGADLGGTKLWWDKKP